jgi:hypothetical protein
VFPAIRTLHNDLQNLAALLNSPDGGSFAIAFAEKNEETEAQIARYIASANRPAEA